MEQGPAREVQSSFSSHSHHPSPACWGPPGSAWPAPRPPPTRRHPPRWAGSPARPSAGEGGLGGAEQREGGPVPLQGKEAPSLREDEARPQGPPPRHGRPPGVHPYLQRAHPEGEDVHGCPIGHTCGPKQTTKLSHWPTPCPHEPPLHPPPQWGRYSRPYSGGKKCCRCRSSCPARRGLLLLRRSAGMAAGRKPRGGHWMGAAERLPHPKKKPPSNSPALRTGKKAASWGGE